MSRCCSQAASSRIVTGRIASATLQERGFLGLDFTDYFHLVEVDGQWQIVSKTFTTLQGR